MTTAFASTVAPSPPRRGRRHWARSVASVAMAVAAFAFALPRVADYGDAWRLLSGTEVADLGLLWVLAVWNLASYWPLLMLGLPGLTVRQAAVSSQVGTAVSNTMPAGSALGTGITIAMYRRWGFSAEETARALLVTGTWNLGTKLLLVVAAGAWAPDGLAATAAVVLLAGVVLVVAVLRGGLGVERAVGRLGAVARRLGARWGRTITGDWVSSFRGARCRAADVLGRRWPIFTAAALVSHLSLFAVLAAALDAVGAGVALVDAFAVFAVVRVALIIPVTPGGAGLAEVGMASLLVAAGAADVAAVAGVLMFRAVTWALPIVVGALCWWIWHREQSR